MSDNPYRFTVEVRRSQGRLMQWWHVDVLDKYGDRIGVGSDHLSEAEANEHAELIRQAMREVS
jgi:pentose-5-phosphate-3-epimerase